MNLLPVELSDRAAFAGLVCKRFNLDPNEFIPVFLRTHYNRGLLPEDGRIPATTLREMVGDRYASPEETTRVVRLHISSWFLEQWLRKLEALEPRIELVTMDTARLIVEMVQPVFEPANDLFAQ